MRGATKKLKMFVCTGLQDMHTSAFNKVLPRYSVRHKRGHAQSSTRPLKE